MAMDSFDGYLQVPPERSQILGRQSWKTRYVCVGFRPIAGAGRDARGGQSSSQSHQSRANSALPKALKSRNSDDEAFLSVYKAKDDGEPIQQWPLRGIIECQVQQISHRKHAPVQPTLLVTLSDNARKRRSSRATGFMSSNRDSGLTTLWFRNPPDDHHRNLHEWARMIMLKRSVLSPNEGGPVSPDLASPFRSRSDEGADYVVRMGSGHQGLQQNGSSTTYTAGPWGRPIPFTSQPPSLRSKRSDISSPSGTHHAAAKVPYDIPNQHYTTILPGDIVSPAHSGGNEGQLVEGWSSIQGRSSTLSSPARGRDSLGSQDQQPSLLDLASPPAPGETILDRAFQLGQIPGAEYYVPGQEKLSSIARFDALMREAEERKRIREASQPVEPINMRSAFDDDDSPSEEEDEDVESDCESHSQDGDAGSIDSPLTSPSAHRALAHTTSLHHGGDGRSKPHRSTMSGTQLGFHADVSPASSPAPPSRPHTAHAKSRPMTARTPVASDSIPLATTAPDMPPSSKPRVEGHRFSFSVDKRSSNASAQRLSFSDFTKRVSGTSSILLVQTSASQGSSHMSNEADRLTGVASPRTNLNHRGNDVTSRTANRDDEERRCGWRGSVGVIGSEGGFL